MAYQKWRLVEAVLGKRPTHFGCEYLIKYENTDLFNWEHRFDVDAFPRWQVEKVVDIGTFECKKTCLAKWPECDAEMWVEPEHVGLTDVEAYRLCSISNENIVPKVIGIKDLSCLVEWPGSNMSIWMNMGQIGLNLQDAYHLYERSIQITDTTFVVKRDDYDRPIINNNVLFDENRENLYTIELAFSDEGIECIVAEVQSVPAANANVSSTNEMVEDPLCDPEPEQSHDGAEVSPLINNSHAPTIKTEEDTSFTSDEQEHRIDSSNDEVENKVAYDTEYESESDTGDEVDSDGNETGRMEKTRIKSSPKQSPILTQGSAVSPIVPETSEQEEQEYQISDIERILGHRKQPGTDFEYKVRWRTTSVDTWLPGRTFHNLDQVLIDYYKSHPKNSTACSKCPAKRPRTRKIQPDGKVLDKNKRFGSGLDLHKYLRNHFTNVCPKCGKVS